MNIKLTIQNPRPFFAELPYYLWGEVNYNSEGNCKCPTDRMWTYYYLENRDSEEYLEINGSRGKFLIRLRVPLRRDEKIWSIPRSSLRKCGKFFSLINTPLLAAVWFI